MLEKLGDMAQVMFKIGNTDYTDKVVSDSFTVRSVKQYTGWTDANGNEHRSVYRTQISGSFSLYFPEISDYDDFCTDLENSEHNDTSVTATVWVNNLNSAVTADFFLDLNPARYIDAKWADMVGKVSISIKER